jgi:hypothetical protein
VNLWPPLYAILHFAASYHGQKAATLAMVQAGEGFATGLSIMTNTELGNILSDYAAITGYLSLSIPMISWLVISASGSMMAGLAGRLMEGYERPVSHAAGEASSGNVSLGQLNYQNESAFKSHSAPQSESGSMSIQGEDGIKTTITANGHYLQAPASSIPIAVNLSDSVTASIRKSHSEAASYERSTMLENLSSNGHLESQKNSAVELLNHSKSYSEDFSNSDRRFLSHSSERTENLINQFAKDEGLSERAATTTRKAIDSVAGIGGSMAVAELSAKVNGQLSSSDESVSQEQIGKMMQFMSSHQYNEAARAEATTAKELLGKIDSSSSKSQDHSLTKALDRHSQISNKHHEASAHLEQISEQKENLSQISSAISETGTDGLINWITSKKGIPETEVRNLISNYNLGDPYAKKSFHELSHEYVEDYIRDHAHQMHFKNTENESNFENEFNQRSSNFSKNHQPPENPPWEFQNKFEQLESGVANTFNNPNFLKNDKNSLDQSGRDLGKEYEMKKTEHQKPLLNKIKELLP